MKTHLMTNTPTYGTWRGMLERCSNPNNRHWHIYGAKGITVCQRWQKFENFLADMGERPEGKTLDRIDNSKGYNVDNCRWATSSEQSRNTERNVWIEWDGKLKVLKDWAREMGLTDSALSIRIERWGLERAMTVSKMKNGNSVLTDDDVLEMRKARAVRGYFWGAKKFAEEYGVTTSAVQNAVRGASFGHLPHWETFR